MAITVSIGLSPFFVSLYYLITEKKFLSRSQKITSGGMITAVIYFFIVMILGESSLGTMPTASVFLGISFAILAGIGLAGVSIVPKALNSAGLSTRQILPLRFLLTIVVGLIFCPSGDLNRLAEPSFILAIAAIGLIGVGLPVFLYQWAVEMTNPYTVSLTTATLPVYLIAVECFDPRLNISWYTAIGAIFVTVISLFGLVSNTRAMMREKAKTKNQLEANIFSKLNPASGTIKS